MQIGNAIGQYQTNMQSSPSVGNKGEVERTPSSGKGEALSSLSAGTVFEGTISGMKNGQVRIALPDGSQISARLGADVPIKEGESLFFEVKSNEGGLIELRPFAASSGINNPTILSALDAAGIRATPENVRMVDIMMQESLSIDRNSLAAMARLIGKNPEIAPETLIQMQKYDLPISPEMAAQYENYRADSHQILNKMNEILTSVTNTLGNQEMSAGEAIALNERLIGVLTGSASEEAANAGEKVLAGKTDLPGETALPGKAETAAEGNAAMNLEGAIDGEEGAAEGRKTAEQPGDAKGEAAKTLIGEREAGGSETKASIIANENAAAVAGKTGESEGNLLSKALLREEAPGAQKTMTQQPIAPEAFLRAPEAGKEAPAGALSNILPKQELLEMGKNLAALDQDGILRGKGLSMDMRPEEFLKTLSEALKELPNPDEKALKNLLSGKGYLTALKEMTREAWTVKPENLSGDRIKDLYENLDRQMRQTEHVLREMGMKDSDLAKSVADLKNNLEFMNQVNQHYTYLQIPFRLQNQNAHSDLYVYTNKKNLRDPDAELSAFLHLDMEHLGSTDVSVRMKNRSVSTKFYLEDEAAFDLILSHADELTRRLEKKGYTCKVEAVNEEKDVDFVEDFLEVGGVRPSASSHLIHRYSFDIKA